MEGLDSRKCEHQGRVYEAKIKQKEYIPYALLIHSTIDSHETTFSFPPLRLIVCLGYPLSAQWMYHLKYCEA